MLKAWVAVLLVLGLAGCSIHTKNVRLNLPDRAAVAPIAGRAVVLEPAVDARVLTDAPSSAGNKIDAGFLKALGPAKSASLISGVGDDSKGYAVLLPAGQSVASLTNDLVAGIFAAKGYTVYRDDADHPGVPRVSVRVTQFYLNQPFNFFRVLTWTSQMKASIATDVTVKDERSEQTYSVIGHGANIVQSGRDVNYQETYAAAMADYARDFNAKVFGKL